MHSSLIASVADTTSYRDRDSINHAVAGLVLEFLNADSAIIYRLIDEGAGLLLSPCVSLTAANRSQADVRCFATAGAAAVASVPGLEGMRGPASGASTDRRRR